MALTSQLKVIQVNRSHAVTAGLTEGELAPISGWANIEEVDRTDKWLIRVGGIDYGTGVKPITYEHPLGVINVIGQTRSFEVKQSPSGAPGLWFTGVLYMRRPVAREVYETSVAMRTAGEELGEALSLFVSIEGSAPASHAVRMSSGVLEIKQMRLDSLAVTSSPLNTKSAWGPGYDWLPVAASLAAAVGHDQFFKVLAEVRRQDELELMQSGVGYPAGAADPVSRPGTELAQLVPSNMNAPSRGDDLTDYIVETLKVFPQMTWSEGEAATKKLISLLNGQRP